MMLLIKRSHLPQSKSKSKRDKNEEAGSKHEWLQLEPLSSFAPFYIWFVDLDQRKRTCCTSCQHHDYALHDKKKI